MNHTLTTVMDPGGAERPALSLSAPDFSEGEYKLVYKESVTDWNENVLDCAEGGDNNSKGIAA